MCAQRRGFFVLAGILETAAFMVVEVIALVFLIRWLLDL